MSDADDLDKITGSDEVLRVARDLGAVPVPPLDLASTVLWPVVAGVVVSPSFRWEPRSW